MSLVLPNPCNRQKVGNGYHGTCFVPLILLNFFHLSPYEPCSAADSAEVVAAHSQLMRSNPWPAPPHQLRPSTDFPDRPRLATLPANLPLIDRASRDREHPFHGRTLASFPQDDQNPHRPRCSTFEPQHGLIPPIRRQKAESFKNLEIFLSVFSGENDKLHFFEESLKDLPVLLRIGDNGPCAHPVT